ncbi:MAG: IS200/IS605 family transposase [Nitrosopumilus sp.]
MNITSNLRCVRHCVFNMHIHLVFLTKYRKKIFSKKILKRLSDIFSSVCDDFESTLEEFDGEKDHIHLLITYPPKVSVSKLVNSLKGVSSRRLKQEFPEIKQYYWKNQFWSPSYFAGSCGGAPLEVIQKYIESQNTPS